MLINDETLQKQLPFPIRKSLCIGELIVVMVDDDKPHGRGDKTINKNIYAFNADGTLRWQIKEAPDGGDEWPKPYTSIKFTDGKVFVHNWIGTDYLLDLNDGSVRFYGPPRRPW